MTPVKDTPILFSAPMVCAIPDRKNQTRRAFSDRTKKIMHSAYLLGEVSDFINNGELAAHDLAYILDFCPYGKPGDRLWVKETYFAYGLWEKRYSEKKGRNEWHFIDMTIESGRSYQYAADNPDVHIANGRGIRPGWYKRPAIFMPRTASRTTLEITNVRVEWLNDISESDARSEGLKYHPLYHEWGGVEVHPDSTPSLPQWRWYEKPTEAFRHLWESINGAGSWKSNPVVWVVDFVKVS